MSDKQGESTGPIPPRADNGSGPVDLTGHLMGDYQVLRRLGRGGMADVYVAQQKSLGRQVAIKFLRSDLACDANYVERFRREARAVAKLSHANIVQVFEVGQQDSHHYIVQEFVDGQNLREKMEREGVLTVPDAVKVLAGVTDALIAASEAGVTHRDIKPENIMLSRRGEIKVADFGLARVLGGEPLSDLTQIGLTMGTPRYMSPEQVQGKTVDARSDLYSLGVTMFHLLCGRPPFEADDALTMAVKHLQESPPDLTQLRAGNDLPTWLVEILQRLMNKAPEDRPQSPQELAAAIHAGIAQVSPSFAHTTGMSLSATMALQRAIDSQKPKHRSTHWKTAGLWLVPLLGLLGGAAWSASQPAPTISQLLSADSLTVEKFDSAAAQFLEAARVDQPIMWRAVWNYHPPDQSQSNADYAIKAKLQLARLYQQRGEWDSSVELLQELVNDGELELLYRTLALAYLVQALDEQQNAKAAGKWRSELQKSYQQLADTNPLHLELFHSKAPRSVAERLKPQ